MTTTINASTSTGLVSTADTSGIIKVQSNGVTTNALAWVNFQGGSGNTAGTINSSYNVSSVTVLGTGNYTVNFTNAMSNANYIAVVQCRQYTASGYNLVGETTSSTAQTTSAVTLQYVQCNTTAPQNPDIAGLTVFGT
jgi:hypothetical protein